MLTTAQLEQIISDASIALADLTSAEASHAALLNTMQPIVTAGATYPDLPKGYRRPGDFRIGYTSEMILPDWKGGAGTQFNPSQVNFRSDGSAELVYVSKDLSGELQVINPKRGSGKWGFISRSLRPNAVCAMFTYGPDGTEIDFEWRGDNVWQMNLHLKHEDGSHAVPVTLPTFAMADDEIAKWHRYEFELTDSYCAFTIDGTEVARITPESYSKPVVWKTDSKMDSFMSVEHHGSWAKHDYSDLPATFEIAGIYV